MLKHGRNYRTSTSSSTPAIPSFSYSAVSPASSRRREPKSKLSKSDTRRSLQPTDDLLSNPLSFSTSSFNSLLNSSSIHLKTSDGTLMSKALEDDLQENKSSGIKNLQSNVFLNFTLLVSYFYYIQIRTGSSYSSSAHVSFMSPPVQNSHTSTSSTLSYLSLDALQSSCCKTYKEQDPTSSGISRSTPSLSSRSAEIPSYGSRMKELITSSVLYPSSRRVSGKHKSVRRLEAI